VLRRPVESAGAFGQASEFVSFADEQAAILNAVGRQKRGAAWSILGANLSDIPAEWHKIHHQLITRIAIWLSIQN
jgi:hypothetical protein